MDARRVLYFVLGAVGATLVVALAFAGVAYFVPRFLNYTNDYEHRVVIIVAAAVILAMNIFRRQMRRRRAKAPARGMKLT
jgi:membrane protein DedA with SNARE-associated domain